MEHGGQRDRSEGALSMVTVLSTYIPAIVLGLGHGIATPAVPVLAKSYDIPFGVASLVIIIYLAGSMTASIPTGYLIDRVGRRKVILGGPILTALVSFLVPFAGTFPELLALRFFEGWAAQMWSMGRVAAIADRASAQHRGRQISWMFAMDNVGSLSGPLVGGLIAEVWGIRAPFVVYGLLATAAVVPSFWLIKESTPGRAAPGPVVAQAFAGRWRTTVQTLVLPFLVLFVVDFLVAVARGPMYAGTLHLYAAFAYDLSPSTIGIIATVGSAVGLPISFTAGWMMDRFGRKATMVPGFAGLGLGMLLLALTAYLQLPLLGYVAAFMCTAAAQALTGGSVQTLATDVAPAASRGQFLGLWRLTGQVGTVTSPVVFAFLSDRVGYWPSFTFLASAALLAAFLLATRVEETLREELPRPAVAY